MSKRVLVGSAFIDNWNPATVLFRSAVEQRDRSLTKSIDNPTDIELRARIVDSVISCIILAHASMESALLIELRRAGLGSIKWPEDSLKGLTALAVQNGRINVENYPQDLIDRYQKVAALRNYLQHGDVKACEDLITKIPDISWEYFNSSLAEEVISIADNFFDFFNRTTGIQSIGSSKHVWVNLGVVYG